MILDLVTLEQGPHIEVLRTAASEVQFPLSFTDKAFAHALKDKFIEINGVGLAAPQVGKSKQIFVIGIDESAKALRKDSNEIIPPTILFNATYEPLPGTQRIYDWEACFSVNHTMAKVPRYQSIRYTANTFEGQKISEIAHGFTARVLQHEIDHTHGILFIDRLDAISISGHPDQMMEKRIEEFDRKQLLIFQKTIDTILSRTPSHPKADVFFKLKDKVNTLLQQKTA